MSKVIIKTDIQGDIVDTIPEGYKRVWQGEVRKYDMIYCVEDRKFEVAEPDDLNSITKEHYCVIRKIQPKQITVKTEYYEAVFNDKKHKIQVPDGWYIVKSGIACVEDKFACLDTSQESNYGFHDIKTLQPSWIGNKADFFCCLIRQKPILEVDKFKKEIKTLKKENEEWSKMYEEKMNTVTRLTTRLEELKKENNLLTDKVEGKTKVINRIKFELQQTKDILLGELLKQKKNWEQKQ